MDIVPIENNSREKEAKKVKRQSSRRRRGLPAFICANASTAELAWGRREKAGVVGGGGGEGGGRRRGEGRGKEAVD